MVEGRSIGFKVKNYKNTMQIRCIRKKLKTYKIVLDKRDAFRYKKGTFEELGLEMAGETRPELAASLFLCYCENMKNITVSLDDELYRRARIRAAERDTSVSALVREFLTGVAEGGSEAERLKCQERALRQKIESFRAADRLAREDVHGRGA